MYCVVLLSYDTFFLMKISVHSNRVSSQRSLRPNERIVMCNTLVHFLKRKNQTAKPEINIIIAIEAGK